MADRQDHPYEQIFVAFFERAFPLDLKIIAAWTAIAIACIYLPVINETPLRILFALPVVLFIPGYALIAALFPGRSEIGNIERLALSFGLSIAVVPLIGLALNYTPWGIRLDPIVISLTLFTAAMMLVAQYRRTLLPPEEQYAPPVAEMKDAIKSDLFSAGQSRLDRALSIILIIAIIAAVATTVFVIVVPKEGEKFTEFFVLGEKQKAADYPTQLAAGDKGSLYIGIGNHEYRTINYTVETYLLTMNFDEKTNTSSLAAMDRLDRFTVPVENNQTVVQPYSFSPGKTSYNRIEFLLFNETVPSAAVIGMDRINSSYRDLHLWLTVIPG